MGFLVPGEALFVGGAQQKNARPDLSVSFVRGFSKF